MSLSSGIVNVNISELDPLILISQQCKDIVEGGVVPVPRQYIHLPIEFKTLGDVRTYLSVARFWGITDELPYKLYKFVLDHTNYQFTGSKLDVIDFGDLLKEFWMIPRIQSVKFLITLGVGYRLLFTSAELCDISLLKLIIDNIGQTLGVNYKSIAKKIKKHTETRKVVIKKELNFHPAIITYLRKYINSENFVVDYDADPYYRSEGISEKNCEGECSDYTDKRYINNQTGEIYEMCEQCTIWYMMYPENFSVDEK